MKGKVVLAGLVGSLLFIFLGTSEAGPRRGKDFRQWGIGWDDGIAMRYLISPSWGVGLQLKPKIWDYESDTEVERPSPQDSYDDGLVREESTILLGAMVFQQSDVGKWLGVGPYFRLYYEHETEEYYTYNTSSSEWNSWVVKTDNISIELGIRPTFRFDERLVLETRFGIGLSNLWRGSERRRQIGDYREGSSQDTEVSTFTTFGQNLGPGSVLQFIIYF